MASLVEGDVHIPGIGNMSKKAAAGGVIVAGGIVGIAYYRHRNAASSSSTSATDTSGAIDPSTGVPYADEYSGGIDPSTGIPYADEGGYGATGIDPLTGLPYVDEGGTGITGTGTSTGSGGYTTNADWATAAENALQAQGVSPSTAATAISKILAGLPVTSAQQDIFLEAVGLLGSPPNGYPQPIKLTDTPGHPGTTKVKIPNVVGTDVEQASQILTAEGLKPKGPSGVKGEIHTVTATEPKVGSTVNTNTTVTLRYKTTKESSGHKSGGGGVIHK